METDAQFQEILGRYMEYFSTEEEPAPLLLYQEELAGLLRLEKETIHGRSRFTILRGESGCGKKLTLCHLAYICKKPVYFIDAAILLRKYSEYGSNLLQMLTWNTVKQGCWLCICRWDIPEEPVLWEQMVWEFIREGASCFITTDKRDILPNHVPYESVEFVFSNPNAGERQLLWQYFLSESNLEKRIDPAMLGFCYRINGGGIQKVIRSAELLCISQGKTAVSEKEIRMAAQSICRDSLGQCAKRIPCMFTWDDFAADQNVTSQLHNLCNQVKYQNTVGNMWGFYEKRPYGNGICALFYGPPGTGKTMAAQVVAGDLGLQLYRVDLSVISSKYIGETQKNITALFETAKEQNAVLFFDEADALFSRRAEVKDANDRHANNETAHLLQQLEDYEGVVILATNLKGQIDDAFKRRIKMMIGFRLPDFETRKVLWRKAIPACAPMEEGINLEFFAERFEIAGSEIKEIVLDAAFLAAAEPGEKITRKHICEAMKTCYEKYGRVLSERDFEEKYPIR